MTTTKATDPPTDTEEEQSICCSRRLRGRGCYACGADPGLLCFAGGCVGCAAISDPICSDNREEDAREEAAALDRVAAGLGSDYLAVQEALSARESTDRAREDSGPTTDLAGSVTSVGGSQERFPITDADRRWYALLREW